MRKMNRSQFQGGFWEDAREELGALTNDGGYEVTNERAIVKAMIESAKRGDVNAAKFLLLRENGLEPGPTVVNIIVQPDDLRL